MSSSIFFPEGNKTNTEICICVHPCGVQLDQNIEPILHVVGLCGFYYTEPMCIVHLEGGIYSISRNHMSLDSNLIVDAQLNVLG